MHSSNHTPKTPAKTAFTIVESNGKSFWLKIGVAFVNRDGSLQVKLDALPTNGVLQLRDYESREDYLARRAGAGQPALPSVGFGDVPEFGATSGLRANGHNGAAASDDASPF